MKVWFILFCRDPQAQLDFYTALLGWPEAAHSRSPIYRAVERDGVQIGFNAPQAYALLGLGERQPAQGAPAPVTAYATFMLDSPADVDAAAVCACQRGGSVVKPPYASYYGQWQAVLADPEGHVFRASCVRMPHGVSPAARPV